MSGIDLAALPRIEIESIEPSSRNSGGSTGAGDMDPDLTDHPVVCPHIPRASEARPEFGGEGIIAGGRTRAAV